MERADLDALHDTVATVRRRYVGHILCLPTTRPVRLLVEWAPEDGKKRGGRPQKTTQDSE